MQHIKRLPHVEISATWYEGTAQLLSLTELKSHLFELYFIDWTINRWRRGGNRSTRRKPLVTSFRKCHILQPEDSSPKRDSNPHNSIGGIPVLHSSLEIRIAATIYLLLFQGCRFSVFFRYFCPDLFSADPLPVFHFLYFLLFHLSLSELSVSFCVHFLWDGTHT